MSVQVHSFALALAVLVAVRGLRSGSLDRSGAGAAALLGYCALANPLSLFGTCLLGFYLAGSRATKVKAAVKATYEEADHVAGVSDRKAVSAPAKTAKAGGNRSATQVACNALIGTACAVVWRWLYSGEVGLRRGWQAEGRWCVTATSSQGGEYRSRLLVIAAVAFWAACCGDTFASELGILSSGPPFLITTFRPCPRGTNGGISAWGTLVSFLGGLLVGFLAVVSLLWQGQQSSCGGYVWMLEILAVAGMSGLGGSMLDSLLGGVFQPTYYSKTRSLVVHSSTPAPGSPTGEEIVRVPGSGWDVLSNNGVNALSTLVTAGAAAWYAS